MATLKCDPQKLPETPFRTVAWVEPPPTKAEIEKMKRQATLTKKLYQEDLLSFKGEKHKSCVPVHRTTWTQEEEKELWELRDNGATFSAIAKKLDRTIPSVFGKYKALKTAKEYGKVLMLKKWTPEKDAELLEMMKKGMRYKEIAEATGRSYDAVQQRVAILRRKDAANNSDM